MTLRASQLETLRELDALEGEASVAEMAARLDRSERTVESRFARLMDRDEPLVRFRNGGTSWSTVVIYSLTQQGHQALSEGGGE